MDRLTALEIFVKVVELQSFTDAAAALGISKSHCSKQIRRLEDRLGARLVNRTTRQIGTTAAGAAFYERCTRILGDLEEAEQTVGQLQRKPTGTLRISGPLSFSVRYLGPALADFMAAHPQLNVDLRLADRRVDIVEEGYDLAIRIGSLADSSLIARKLGRVQPVLCASPGYLADNPAPQHPRDLRDHSCLLYHYQATGLSWGFHNSDGAEEIVRVDGRLRADNGDVMVAMACSGLGLIYVPDFLVSEPIRSGALVPLLPEWSHQPNAVWALYPHSRHLSAKVRLFIDFLAARFSPPPWQLDLAEE